MLLFGSFTEDETKSLLHKQSSGKNEKPVEKNQLQFGSLNSVTVNSSKAPDSVPPVDTQKCNGVSVSDNLAKVSQTVKENGSITHFSVSPSSVLSANQVEENNVLSVTLLDEDGPSNQFTNLSLDASEAEI
ncbi:Ubiquitin C-terminal hydrolase + Tagatose 6 phosphate kinase [Sesbania bispinosa]|nr:Ubiquitin C-terminal hydrolase + Tagatose 6 phosphate kinase [Sesbania bispinosa]